MSRRKIKAGTTSLMVPVFIQDSSSSTGAGLPSLVYNSAGLAAKYRRQGDSGWTTITLATATLGTFTSGGFVADGGPVTGGYELGIPNAAIASGAGWCFVELYGVTNMLAVLLEFELDTIDYQASGGKVPATIAAGDIATDAVDANALKADAVTEIVTGVWAAGTRTLTSFGTLVSDVTTAVWANATRTLSSFGTLTTDTATAVWASGTRTLSSFGTLVSDIATAVWSSVSRTLTGFSFTVNTNANATETAAANNASAAALAATTAATKATAASDLLVSITEDVAGAPGYTRFKDKTLEEAPAGTGGGGDNTLDELLSDHTDPGTAGAALSSILAAIAAGTITVRRPFDAEGTLTIVTGDSYISAAGTSLSIDISNRPDLVGLIPHLVGTSYGYTFDLNAPAVVSGTETLTFSDLTSTVTLLLASGPRNAPKYGEYQIRFVDGSGKKVTTTIGVMKIQTGF